MSGRVAAVLAFGGSGCLLILEIVAGRLLAPVLGVSLYTWTSVIGIVLAGVTIGNYFGGRIADRWPTRSAVALIYLAGSIAALTILGLVRYALALSLPSNAPAIIQVLWLNALLFLLPSTIISAATPVLTRLSLHSVDEGGRVVGRIQAAAALGSIVGTFLTGFVLISSFGTRRIVAGVAVTLLVLAIASRPPWPKGRVAGTALAFAIAIIGTGWVSTSNCNRESDYYCIHVEPVGLHLAVDPNRAAVPGKFRALYLDHMLHGVVDVNNPRFFFYGYEQLYADVIASRFQPGAKLDALFIGGGGYAFPRYVESAYTGSVEVVEIDPAVTSIAQSELGLSRSGRMNIHHLDARQHFRNLASDRKFDFILGDAFNQFDVPYQLTTREFDDIIARHLRPDGVYMLNIIDGVHNDFLRSEIRTLRNSFPYVAVLTTPDDWPPREERLTFVIVAALHAPASPIQSAVSESEIDAFMKSGRSVLLTDDFVPVDQLLAPVFSASMH
jgi:MFS family permease